MSRWEDLHFENRIRKILSHPGHTEGHHLGKPYMTSYQIAIEFARRNPEAMHNIDAPLGGEGVGVHHSLAQYIARELSVRIKDKSLKDIEGGFLSDVNLSSLTFRGPEGPITSSLTGNFDVAIFRLKEE